MKNHLFIIICIVIGFSSFMMGYSLPPFMEVGFGQEEAVDGVGDESDLLKQYEKLYENAEEEGGNP